jgi:hypothetical protein
MWDLVFIEGVLEEGAVDKILAKRSIWQEEVVYHISRHILVRRTGPYDAF